MFSLLGCEGTNGLLANLPDASLTASSNAIYTHSHGPERSRLNTVYDLDGIAGWASGSINPAWIQADLRQAYFVYKVATQGRGDHSYQQWVTVFTLAYGFDTETLEYILDQSNSNVRVFMGNTDKNTIVYNEFDSVLTRFIRLYVLEWNGAKVMRWEV